MGRYGRWGKHIELFTLWEDFNEDETVREALMSEDESLAEGTGAPEGRADFPIFLQTVIRNRMRERFRTVQSRWREFVGTESAQDFREHTITELGGIRGIEGVNEDGEYPRLRSREKVGPSFAVGKHGGTYSVTMELVINDDVDQILNRTPRELARAMGEYRSHVVIAFIESNPTYGPDGQPFFSPAHDNEVTGAAAAPNETNLMALLDQMTLKRDEDNNPIGIEPQSVVVRTRSQRGTFNRIIKSQQTLGQPQLGGTPAQMTFGQFLIGTANPAYQALPDDAVKVEPWLNDPNDYIIMANAEDRPPFVFANLRGQNEPFIGLKDQGARDAMGAGSDPYSWWFDHVDYKIRDFFGVAPGEPLAALRARP
jgi:hypothetical protein